MDHDPCKGVADIVILFSENALSTARQSMMAQPRTRMKGNADALFWGAPFIEQTPVGKSAFLDLSSIAIRCMDVASS
ncbi:hypothetical protein C6366_13880 [Desulfonatronum sp. SC1]|nr:hypothetical protein C6366_13880 [Desulfonatronum sp. SC1]